MCTLSLPIVLDAPDDKAMIHYGGFPHLVDLVLDYSLCDPPSLLGLKPYSKEWEERCSQVSSDDFSLLRSLGPVCKGWKERISTHMFFSPDKRVEQTLSITAFDKEGRQSFAHEKGFVITKAAPAGTYLMDWWVKTS
jgi:hypothetical protein